MKNRIVFIGTAGDTASRQKLKAGGFVLSIEGGQYHVDPGPGAVSAAGAAGISLRENICVITSNNSLLASEGINEVLDAMTLSGTDSFGVAIVAKSVLHGTDEERPIIRNEAKGWVERVLTFEETNRAGVNYLTVHPKKAKHKDETALSFVFETPKTKIGYTGDSEYFRGLSEELAGCDYLVVRCPNPAGSEEPGMNIDGVIKLLEAVRPKTAILTGFGVKLIREDLLTLARSVQRETGVHTVAARDGFEFILE